MVKELVSPASWSNISFINEAANTSCQLHNKTARILNLFMDNVENYDWEKQTYDAHGKERLITPLANYSPSAQYRPSTTGGIYRPTAGC
ncbi:hypothetical protein SAMN02745123_03750 [Desulforamulus aeronauticus DSM 10349]|uniref:Uncharacterized protein n=1 Tax=Desulforamulus aeronauticus DSM 10349 TaxID=1121421 RepID=A0A1M6WSK5_9FIRM|nr:hypothetical protein SAMN02745123_03750 [Desulforamulus aeronauticus DSM 10349]